MISRGIRNVLMNVYFLISAVCVLILDQVTKYIIIEKLPISSEIEVIRGFFYITHLKNTGAAFGLFQDSTRTLTIISFVAIVLIIILKIMLKLNYAFYNVSLGFILGGALGNLIDRYFVGEVTDFLNFTFWPVFNIADSFIIIGFCLIIILILREYLKKGKTQGS
ncbi:MAG: signal peptidase II [Actinobacteria bacterium]|nr:signal peptidase II [Actinomycetota bacterium]MBU4314581.1 signal peptidase II [Actinomycetota bacterium]MBU4482714.1 signal peptidase II [Actinomycetota bacterium]MCG2790911.1 signal peptidase II [Actinomycetes bacterium]